MRLRPGVLILLALPLLCAAQTRRALVIGIDTYQPAGTTAEHPAGCAYGRCELGTFENLKGAVNDAQAMADLLTSPKFGFPPAQVALLTNPAAPQPRPGVNVLPAGQTARDGILAAMQKYLVDLPQRGDTVVFYDASHGSLRVNSKGSKMTVLMNGALVHADSTLVPADAYKGGFDVSDHEMTRIFQAALDKGVHLTVIFDSCHSGGATRGLASPYRARTLAFDPRDLAEAPATQPAPTLRTDNPALVFSAAQQDQEADEAEPTPAQPEAHGAFTSALIEALEALPANAPASLVYQRVKAVIEGSNFTNQEPDLDATAARRRLPLFGGTAASDTKKLRTAALATDADGNVWLDVGRVSGVGAGTEFVSTAARGSGEPIRLRVTELQGIARSTAAVVSPAGAKVAAGEIFELAKWVPAETPPLKVWTWPANLSETDIRAAAAQIRLAGVVSIQDPAEQPWTEMLSWNGTEWLLQHAQPSAAGSPSAPATVANGDHLKLAHLGPKLTADALKQHLAADAKVWVNLPPSQEMFARLQLHEPDSAVQASPDLASANYILTGVLTGDDRAYAWFNRQQFDAGPRAAMAKDHSPGCSATSQYPVRSDWVPLRGPGGDEHVAAELNRYALLLAKVHGWIELADSPTGASAAQYYSLAMVRSADRNPLAAGEPAAQDEELLMTLKASAPVTERRWVYVLDIDCHGKGSLLYPRDLTENQFPSDADSALQFVLPGSPTLRIGPPYGVDTMVMLSTAQPLPDPYALEFEGVATRGDAAGGSPLARLLTNASRGTRGAPGPVPTDWGIDLLTLHSAPKDAAN